VRQVQLLIIFSVIFFISPAYGKYNFSAQGSYMHFLGETKLTHFGGGLKLEYVYNDWVAAYGGVNYYGKNEYVGIVEAEAIGDATRPFLIDIPVLNSSVSFIQLMFGTRMYFYGELDPPVKGGFGFYGIGEFGLLAGISEGNISKEGYDLYNVPITDEVKGFFWNYTGAIGVGGEKQIGRPFVYVEAKFNATIDEANPFVISTRIPFGMSYFIGLRIPLSTY
jgi:hypothetical protein